MLINKQCFILAGFILRGSEVLGSCFEKDIGIGRHRDDSVKIQLISGLFTNVQTNS